MDRGDAVARFAYEIPSLDSYWRAIVLFGRNVASFKFALAGALLEVGADPAAETISLEQLALPFATRIAEHLRTHDKQGTSPRSQFLDACRAFNRGELDSDGLQAKTVRLGFGDVIDAFHNIDRVELSERFFLDERRQGSGLRLTDNLRELLDQGHGPNLKEEVEARWRLVETAWELNVANRLLTVEFEPVTNMIVVPADIAAARNRRRRRDITSARGPLDGYQKGCCFYCYSPIDITSKSDNTCHVDHVFAWSTGDVVGGAPVEGVWNLVLACARCNGWQEKSDRPPHERYVERLNKRNESLIASEHPLRATLIAQTGRTPLERSATLNRAMQDVSRGSVRDRWTAPEELDPVF